jgi:alpha-tubulin suppressor-like RCC1 family protein
VADGTDAFTGSMQPYYQYAGALLGPDGMLSQNETSSPRTWTFAGPPTVGQFTFQVAVWTTVPLPDGWIEVAPASDSVGVGGHLLFSTTVYTAVGDVRTGAVPWWSSSDTTVAKVDSASGEVLGIAAGSATVTAHYRNATGSAAVHVYGGEGPQFIALSTFEHSCGLAPGGIAWCWGNDSDGQLGTGVVDTAKAPNAVPRAVTGGHAFQEVVAGYASACGLDTGGEVWCWGSNQFGQLGVASAPESCVLNGTVTYACSSTPLPLSGTLRFTSLVSGGGLFWCGIAVGGDSYCWGNDQFGQLGDSTSTAAQVPVLPVKVSGGHPFAVLAAGYQHACGLEADGKAYCWGIYQHGRLGVAAPGYCPHNGPCNSAPTPVLGTLRFKSISAASVSTCAVTTDGVAYCWGTNFRGQMGTGGTSSTAVSTPTAVNTSLRFTSISAAPTHTCAVAADGQGYCWGSNTEGRLGDGTEVDRYLPRLVAGGHTFPSISAGTGSSCGLGADGNVYCWGAGGWGQMGNGTLNGVNPTPMLVAAHP